MSAAVRLAIVAAALALGSTGCESLGYTGCDRSAEGNPTVQYTAGTTEGGVYTTSAWNGELLSFPGGMRYELTHGLGVTPRWIQSYLSFDRDGTGDDGGALSPAAGNQVVVLGADEKSITIANDSCVAYYLLLTAGSGAQP